MACDLELADAEELDFRQPVVDHRPHQVERVRPLQLEAEDIAAFARHDHVFVAGDFDRQVGLLGVELQPVARRRRADHPQEICALTEDDGIGNQMPTGVHHYQLLRPHGFEVAQIVGGKLADKGQPVGPANVQLGHMERLFEQHDAMVPGALLVAPVGELGRDTGKNDGPVVGRAQHVERAAVRLNFLFEVHRLELLILAPVQAGGTAMETARRGSLPPKACRCPIML